MRAMLSTLGTALIAVGLGGLVLVAFGATAPSPPGATDATNAPAPNGTGRGSGAAAGTGSFSAPADAAATPRLIPRIEGAEAPPAPSLPITRAAIPRISLVADVVPAALVDRDGGTTWDVPAFRAGHAQGTAGAGEAGNAVLLGHVSSRDAGNVFRDLDRVRVGDVVRIFSGERGFDYRVVDVRVVPRTDLSAVHPTETATVSLVTCTGLWLPTIWDYTERLIVRADLIAPSIGAGSTREGAGLTASD